MSQLKDVWMSLPEIELISFELCPFVQRSVVTLLEKGISFKRTNIDLANKPDWFLSISPLGKVPVLRMGDLILFESAVINEYLDEITPPSLHPADPGTKALNRAWIEYASQLFGIAFRLVTVPDAEAVDEQLEQLLDRLLFLERNLGQGPFFNGADFALVDAAFAPLFIRLDRLVIPALESDLYAELPGLRRWAEVLLARESVQKACPDDFAARATERFCKMGSYLLRNSYEAAE
jgi:glutathione S-transferase